MCSYFSIFRIPELRSEDKHKQWRKPLGKEIKNILHFRRSIFQTWNSKDKNNKLIEICLSKLFLVSLDLEYNTNL